MTQEERWVPCPHCGERLPESCDDCGYCGFDVGAWKYARRMLTPADCDELGYCIHCRSATLHFKGCVVI